ncbi:MAG: methyltransferase domain-containing protein [Betaproteobacteria bacterium]|nr:methyltransferase domain-containing protein [Betaproteobacteria bacterium]
MTKPMPAGRRAEDVRHQYEVEKALAAKLRAAPAEERRHLYAQVYDEMFRLCPDHPQLVRKRDPSADAAKIERQLTILRNYVRPEHTYLEIGPGDCALTVAMARIAHRCIAVDVSTEVTRHAHWPDNMELIISDGSSIPVPSGSVDVAYSNQLMEHLHPDDAGTQLVNIVAALKPGGLYLCCTPNRLSGPHDISGPFDEVATGFHLREYTIRETMDLFRRAGFRRFGGSVVVRGRFYRHPLAPLLPVEAVLGALPRGLCQAIADSRWPRLLLGSISSQSSNHRYGRLTPRQRGCPAFCSMTPAIPSAKIRWALALGCESYRDTEYVSSA